MPTRTVKVRFPHQYKLNGKIGKNVIQQLFLKSSTESAIATTYQVGRSKGMLYECESGRKVYVSSRGDEVPTGVTEHLKIGSRVALSVADVNYNDPIFKSRWVSPLQVNPAELSAAESESGCSHVRLSWDRSLLLRESNNDEPGLRPPQMGALFAALSHWKVFQTPATIVMPTGTGKTETMLSLLVTGGISKLLVVVPTGALREQIFNKFLTLGILRDFGIIPQTALNPVVGFLGSEFENPVEAEDFFSRCNVVVTTMQLVSGCSTLVQRKISEMCSHLFIDEAHHVSARTWNSFKKHFDDKRVIQFTATPFRNDGKPIEGKVIFNYPLTSAQKDEYFKPINFKTINEYDPEQADNKIASAAVMQLKNDLNAGLDHLIMARTENIFRAGELAKIYTALAPEMSPVIIHSNLKDAVKKEAFRMLQDRQSRIVICVNMLGEGFDFPELKIAAIHDMHRSLAITLQFTGRFTRPKPNVGNACVIANIADPKVEEGLMELYAEDADWNMLLRGLSEGATAKELQKAQFIENFASEQKLLSLRNIFPKMSTVVYQTRCRDWSPSAVNQEEFDVAIGPEINYRNRVLLFITRTDEGVDWGNIKEFYNTNWDLYLVFWDKDQNLLFINSSNNNGLHEELAKSVAGSDVELIRGEKVFRALHDLKRPLLINLGLKHSISRAVTFSMHAGTDITQQLSAAHTANKIKSNTFARGFYKGELATIGCSQKGRVWSFKVAEDIGAWTHWCSEIGKKLLDDQINTDAILRNVIQPKEIFERPNKIAISVEWPEEFYTNAEEKTFLEFGTVKVGIFEAEVRMASFAESGPLQFDVVADGQSVRYEVVFSKRGVEYSPVDPDKILIISRNKKRKTLSEWFKEEVPIIRFENGGFLLANEWCEIPAGEMRIPFDPNNISVFNWSNGTNIRIESQGLDKKKDSVQYKMIEYLKANIADLGYEIIFDDDGSGEAADIVCIGEKDDKIVIHLYHCKYSVADTAGARVEDLYEVCGQAQKCVHWRSDLQNLFSHLGMRESKRTVKKRTSRFELGDLKKLSLLQRKSRSMDVDFKVFIVQPGISKEKITRAQLDLLGSTETYLRETFNIDLSVYCSG